MGFMDKLKGLFKKKDAAPKEEKKAAAPAAAPAAAAYADAFGDECAVCKALKFAAEKLDAKKAAGLPEAKCEAFFGALKAIQASDAPEDAKMVEIGQTIGGIIRAK